MIIYIALFALCLFIIERWINHKPFVKSKNWYLRAIALNLLSVKEDLVIVEKAQLPLIKILEKHGIECVGLQLRSTRTLGGGFHCVTLDLNREGSLESYFD